jgi:hypothetical protein
MSVWGDVAGGALGVYGYSELMDNLGDSQNDVNNQLDTMQGDIKDQLGFQPWGVTSSQLGNVRSHEGGLSYQQNTDQYLDAGRLNRDAMSMFAQAGEDGGRRQQQFYNQMQNQRQPQLQQAYGNLQQGVWGNGTGGMQTTDFGGNPEQYAFGKALADSQAGDMLTAQQMSIGERQQDMALGQSMWDNQYSGMQNLMDQGQAGMNNQQMNNDMTREQASLWSQLGMGGLSANTNFENIRAGAFGDMIKATMPLAQGAGNAIGDLWGQYNPFNGTSYK